MKKFFVFAFVICGFVPAFAQSSIEDNKNPQTKESREQSHNRFYFDLFLGVNSYGEGMPYKVDEKTTISVGSDSNSISQNDVTWGLKDTEAIFFDIGLSFTYLINPKMGLYVDISYLNADKSMKTEMFFINKANNSGKLLVGIATISDGKMDVDRYTFDDVKTKVNGVLFSVGPTFNLINSNKNLFFLTPKFNLQHYTLNVDINDIFVIGSGSYLASYTVNYKNTEIGLGLIADYKLMFNKHLYLSLRAGINFDFYQFKLITEEISVSGLNDKITFEVETNSGVSNFSFVPTIGFGYSF
jgi:hypothetical protein